MSFNLLKIRQYGDPCLRQKAEAVSVVGPGERMLIQSMIATMNEAKGIGLAAPQVGISKRIFVADVGDGPIAIIDPKILAKSGSDIFEEGCLSIPNVTVEIERASKIKVSYIDENNHKIQNILEDLIAKVFQHESDHLDGKMIVDYLTPKDKEALDKELNSRNKDISK